MAISLTRYVNITSGVAGAANVPTRDLVARIFTANNLLPPQSFISFTTAAEVGSFFGYASEEYQRALFYFGWISKNQTQAQSIQFARWVQTAVAPQIYPVQNGGTTLSDWTSISSGSFVLTMGTFTFTISGLNFTGAGSLAAVATIIEDAIQAESGGGALWTGATVTYSSTYGGFLLVGGATGAAAINVVAGGGGTDITPAGLLGWLPEAVNVNGVLTSGAIWCAGSAVETITETLTNSSVASNNFGSFTFLTNLNVTQQNVVDAANWNNTQNVVYMYSQAVTPSNATSWATALNGIGGVGLTLSPPLTLAITGTLTSSSNVVSNMVSNAGVTIGMPVTDGSSHIPAGAYVTSLVSTTGLTLSANATGSGTEVLTFYDLEFPEMAPMMIEAATNYDGLNTVQNYEFQQFNLTPSVSTDANANVYDALNINYYGVTQTAGQNIAFYQRGVLMGLSTNILDMNSYVNEIWLKDAAGAALMTLLLSLNQVPANNQGRNQILAVLQGIVNQALDNGTISVGKALTITQQMYITSATNDPLAWYQVQNNGYWLDVVITASGSPVTYIATYTLIYSKDDVIRKVVGTHTLI